MNKMEFWVIECTSRKKFNILARIIMWLQGINFSHVAIMVTQADHSTDIFEAVYPKARMDSFDGFARRYEIKQSYKLSPPTHMTEIDLRNTLLKHVLTDAYYSIAQLLLIYFQIKFKKWGQLFGKIILNHQKGLICSEVLAKMLTDGWGHQFKEQYDTIDLLESTKAARLYLDKGQK